MILQLPCSQSIKGFIGNNQHLELGTESLEANGTPVKEESDDGIC